MVGLQCSGTLFKTLRSPSDQLLQYNTAIQEANNSNPATEANMMYPQQVNAT